MLDSKNYDLSAKYLIQLDDSIEKDCYYPDETFVAKVLVSFPNLGKQRLQLDSLLLRWMKDPRLPDYIRETASETRTSFQRSEHGRVSRATELCTMRGDVSTLHKLLETRESLVSSNEFQFHSWPKLVKASSFSGTLNVAETLSRLQNTPSAAVESLIVFLTKNPSSPSPLHLISPSIVTSKTLHALTVHFLATPSNLPQLREFLATLKTKFPETSIETRTYNCILHACHKHGHMGLFHYIRQQIKSPDSNTFAQLLIAAQSLGEVKAVLRDMKKQGVGIRNDLANQIMWKVASQDPEVVVSIWRALLRQDICQEANSFGNIEKSQIWRGRY
ncbi:hypothetical protein BCR33DRAFT_780751 [Rhizoclosmatium globosum]|uniref:Pentatricopeptide repeat-containing protein n=1 Tax=Rhizoclosmatium globosum TaxID=329046 RepID=A0A1Y2CV02_9FUNG|nr:hypothetical protein BCR33DRAFT_780751 [Rhizoclosmatium globosum]|eukprot:ORY50843.1 hypothetical protein BCR33DRAFT_780751 [Rhizoclosmatium globosum]